MNHFKTVKAQVNRHPIIGIILFTFLAIGFFGLGCVFLFIPIIGWIVMAGLWLGAIILPFMGLLFGTAKCPACNEYLLIYNNNKCSSCKKNYTYDVKNNQIVYVV